MFDPETYPASYPTSHSVSFPGAKQLEHMFMTNLHLVWNFTSTPLYAFMAIFFRHMDKFIFYINI
jgi:hypothetical protein